MWHLLDAVVGDYSGLVRWATNELLVLPSAWKLPAYRSPGVPDSDYKNDPLTEIITVCTEYLATACTAVW